MRHPSGFRQGVSRVSAAVGHRLDMYALAATAAGAGMAALAQPAQAKIIYRYAHQTIGPITYLDLNHDGVADFKFTTRRVGSRSTGSASLVVDGMRSSNQIQGQSAYASALPPAAYIGPAGRFMGQKMVWLYGDCTQHGSCEFLHRGFWAGPVGQGVQHRYLGLKFVIHGKIHFGWARLNVVTSFVGLQATLTGYAYETIPGKLIVAGRKSGLAKAASAQRPGFSASPRSVRQHTPRAASLGLLALGTQGIPLWRRKDLTVGNQVKAD